MLVDTMVPLGDDAVAKNPEQRRRGRAWTLLLVLPYLGLCFPQMYVRLTPVLWGFPFFYWYQFGWVLLTSAMLGFVYKMQKQKPEDAEAKAGRSADSRRTRMTDTEVKEANGTR